MRKVHLLELFINDSETLLASFRCICDLRDNSLIMLCQEMTIKCGIFYHLDGFVHCTFFDCASPPLFPKPEDINSLNLLVICRTRTNKYYNMNTLRCFRSSYNKQCDKMACE